MESEREMMSEAEKKIEKIALLFENTTQETNRIRVSTNAADNLLGAILTIEKNLMVCDVTSMNTLRRVFGQLVAIDKILFGSE